MIPIPEMCVFVFRGGGRGLILIRLDYACRPGSGVSWARADRPPHTAVYVAWTCLRTSLTASSPSPREIRECQSDMENHDRIRCHVLNLILCENRNRKPRLRHVAINSTNPPEQSSSSGDSCLYSPRTPFLHAVSLGFNADSHPSSFFSVTCTIYTCSGLVPFMR